MSYELAQNWINNPESVTADQIDDAIEAMFLLPPSGPNQSLLGVLSLIKDNPEDTETISILIGRYETQT